MTVLHILSLLALFEAKLEPERVITSSLSEISVILSHQEELKPKDGQEVTQIPGLGNKVFKFPHNSQGFQCHATREVPVSAVSVSQAPMPLDKKFPLALSQENFCTSFEEVDKILRVCVVHGKISVSMIRPQPTLARRRGEDVEELAVGNFSSTNFQYFPSSKSAQVKLAGTGRQFFSEKLSVTLGSLEISGVSGAFNPFIKFPISGLTFYDERNPFGCKRFEKFTTGENIPRFIVVARRGECMFQTKALEAQRAGAVGILIVNDERPMIRWMAPVAGSLFSDIPAALISRKYLNAATQSGEQVVIANGIDQNAHDCEFEINLYCDKRWKEKPWKCSNGDEVIFDHGVDDDRLARIAEISDHAELAMVNLFEEASGEYARSQISVPKAQLYKDKEFNCAGASEAAISELDISDTYLDDRGVSKDVCRVAIDLHVSRLCPLPEFSRGERNKVQVVCGLANGSNPSEHN